MSNETSRTPVGIRVRHARSCPAGQRDGGRCKCSPSFEAAVYSPADGAKVRKTFATVGDAKRWRIEMLGAAQRGKLRLPAKTTLREVADAWVADAEAGRALTRSSQPYKPAVVRGVALDFRLHIDGKLGAAKVSAIRRRDVQRLLDDLIAQGLSGSRVRGVLTSLRIVLRRPLQDDVIGDDPTARLRLPEAAGTRDRAATVGEVERLLGALPADLRVLYSCAAFAGLRRGELRALRWEHVNLGAGVLAVAGSWDEKVGPIAPKSAAGVRTVPIPPILHDCLTELKASSGRSGSEFVFGHTATTPFTPSAVRRRAEKAWAEANAAEREKAAEEERDPELLVPIGLHELRHVWVSFLADAGFPLSQIASFAGHSSVWVSERYRHVLPGAAESAGAAFGAYLDAANTQARLDAIRR
jgi:integrase